MDTHQSIIIYQSRTQQMADEWYVNGGYQYVIIGGLVFLAVVIISQFFNQKDVGKKWW